MKILNKTPEPPEGTGKPHKVIHWYHRDSRSWVIQAMDKHDNEIESSYVGHASHVKNEKEYMKRKHGLIKEDAATNSAGAGHIAAIGVGPDGEPGKYLRRKKYKMSQLVRRWMQGR